MAGKIIGTLLLPFLLTHSAAAAFPTALEALRNSAGLQRMDVVAVEISGKEVLVDPNCGYLLRPIAIGGFHAAVEGCSPESGLGQVVGYLEMVTKAFPALLQRLDGFGVRIFVTKTGGGGFYCPDQATIMVAPTSPFAAVHELFHAVDQISDPEGRRRARNRIEKSPKQLETEGISGCSATIKNGSYPLLTLNDAEFESIWRRYRISVDQGGHEFHRGGYESRPELFVEAAEYYIHPDPNGKKMLKDLYPNLYDYFEKKMNEVMAAVSAGSS